MPVTGREGERSMLRAAYLCGALVACARPVTATFNSRLEIADAPPVKRLVVYEAVEGGAFTQSLHAGLVTALQQRLHACGVAAEIVTVGSVGADADDQVFASVRAHHADVALMLRALGGDVVNHGAERSELYFALTLVEPDRGRPRWRARAQFAFQIQARKQDVDAGVVFGTRIVEQLRDDLVIDGCPPKQASWPAIVPQPSARPSGG